MVDASNSESGEPHRRGRVSANAPPDVRVRELATMPARLKKSCTYSVGALRRHWMNRKTSAGSTTLRTTTTATPPTDLSTVL
jgi:hypothetical protein